MMYFLTFMFTGFIQNDFFSCGVFFNSNTIRTSFYNIAKDRISINQITRIDSLIPSVYISNSCYDSSRKKVARILQRISPFLAIVELFHHIGKS